MRQSEPKLLKGVNLQHIKTQELQKEIVSLTKKNLDNQNQKQVLDIFNETSRRIAELKTYDFSKFCQTRATL